MSNSVDSTPAFPVSPRNAKIVIAVVLGLVAVIDLIWIPASIVLPILYPIVVAACLWARSSRFVWTIAIVVVVLTLTLAQVGTLSIPAELHSVILTNHLAAVLTTLLVAMLVHHVILTQNDSGFQRQVGDARNVELEEINQELGQREEEIVRQNEELQSQTEELERQTEELRVTNEELASWEKRLEQLLELARSLTAETSRSDIFSKICETLGLIADTHATALLERIGDELQIQCHHGFGPEGPETTSLPFSASFSSKVIALGQTGYVEDIRLRPDLKIPQPKQGDAFRAVLSTPLRVGGQTIGAIEAYGSAPRSWTASEVAMIESLAIQAARSIQSAELVEGIRQERRRFEAAFRTVPFGMAVADDARGSHIRINPAAAALFRLPSDENISSSTSAGMRLQKQFAKGSEPLPPNQLPIARSLRGQEVHGEEIELCSPKDPALTLLTSSAPIFDGDGQIAGAVAAFVDITSQKVLTRELDLRRREAEEASVRKTRFLAAVSHDIRTPANAINLMAEIIRRCAGDPARSPEIIEMSQRLQANTHSLMELVGDVLDVARFDTGKMELVTTEFSLGELIDQESAQLQPLARDKGLQLIVEPLSRPIWLRTDRIKLGRVLGNLLGNAIKFTQQGSVRVGVCVESANERRLILRLSDTGIGIPAEHLTLIFDEFAQLHNPARDRSKGSGLGLAICHRLVELLGGTISVESREGAGSTFTIALPTALIAMRTEVLTSTMRERALPATPQQPLNLRILLVEDHSATRDGASRLLRDDGATVVEAADGKTALRLMQEMPFDVVLLDMMLPDFDGREVLRSLQSHRPEHLKGVLVLTGDVTIDRLKEIKELGADGMIAKPIDIKKLLETLQSF